MNGSVRARLSRRGWVLAGLAVAVAIVCWHGWRGKPGPIQPDDPRPVVTKRPGPPELPVPPVISDHPAAAAAEGLLRPGGSTDGDLEIISVLLTEYRKVFGGNPVGENEEIVAAMRGDNARGLRFLAAEHPAVDPAGRLCDRWGTPVFFHAVSARRMEVVSAGPDRTHGTADDLVRAE